MKAHISLTDIDSIKLDLIELLPQVKSSHRVEAMARGLGSSTNAALRAELAAGPQNRFVDNHVFTGYLKEHGFNDTRYDALAEAVVRCKYSRERAAIAEVMAQEQNLTHFGFGVFDGSRKAKAQRDAEFAEERRSMLCSYGVDEFMRACEFLARRGKRKTVNRASTSYGLKHQAEAFHQQHNPDDHYYIANGMFIAAAIHLGFKVQPAGPNAYLNIAAESRVPRTPWSTSRERANQWGIRT